MEKIVNNFGRGSFMNPVWKKIFCRGKIYFCPRTYNAIDKTGSI